MPVQDYLSYILNPLELLRTKKVLHVNPTVASPRKESEQIKIFVHDYDATHFEVRDIKAITESFSYLTSATTTWINLDGLRKADVEALSNHYGIHYLITEDILSMGQRPKMDEIDGLYSIAY